MNTVKNTVMGIVLMLATGSLAQAPAAFMYQGRLTDAAGSPITATVSVRFAIWDVAEGGTTYLWTKTMNVSPVQGVFTVEVGPIDNPATVFDGRTRYLGVKVGSEPEMLPRQKIVSAPYAISAASASAVSADAIVSTSIADNAVIASKISNTAAVKKLNGLTGDVTLTAGSNISLTPSGNAISIAVSANRNALDAADGAPTNAVYVDNAGLVGIGMTTPANILTVLQGSATDPIADGWTTWSSRRWKQNIHPIDNALEKVRRLEGVYFEWKETGKTDLGLIAEDVGAVVPEVVAYEDNGVDARSVDYARLVAVLIESVKTLDARVAELEARLQSSGSGGVAGSAAR